MVYYRVKTEYDNRRRYCYGNNNKIIKHDGILVANELYTPGERKQIAMCDKFFDVIEISSRKTYWFFGARFAREDTNT